MTVQLSLLGAPTVRRPGDEHPVTLALRDGAMLAWLALVGPTTRAQMAALLWHGQAEDHARNSLRQRLFQLRRLVGEDLVVGHAVLQLSPNVEHDLDRGWGLLGNQSMAECPAIDGWLVATRAQRDREQRSGLVWRLDQLEAAGQWASALPLAQVLAQIEPLSEQAHRRLMRLHAQMGDTAAALQTFAHLEQRLREALGMKPDATTQALRQSISSGEPMADAAKQERAADAVPELSPAALTLARLLALAEEPFNLELAEFVLQRHALQLTEAWQELQTRRVIDGSAFVNVEMRERLCAEIPSVIATYVKAQIDAYARRKGKSAAA